MSSEPELGAAIDQVLQSNRKLRRLQGRIVAAQNKLQAIASEDAWHAYMRAEELTNTRLAEVTILIARWAFGEGFKTAGGKRP